MSTYLVVKYSDSSYKYTAKESVSDLPYIAVDKLSQFQLTSETIGTGLFVRGGVKNLS